MFGYINKKKALAIVEGDEKFHRDLYDSYIDAANKAENEIDKNCYRDIANSHRARYMALNRIICLLKKL